MFGTRKSVRMRTERDPGRSSGFWVGCIHSKGTQEEGWVCGNPGSLVDGEPSFGNVECEVPQGHSDGDGWVWSLREA